MLLNERKQKLFADLPPSDEELNLSDASSPRCLRNHLHCMCPRISCSPSEIDSITQVGLDNDDPNGNDFKDAFKPQPEDGYDIGANN